MDTFLTDFSQSISRIRVWKHTKKRISLKPLRKERRKCRYIIDGACLPHELQPSDAFRSHRVTHTSLCTTEAEIEGCPGDL